MTIRITVNGKEYPGVEAMPEEVRRAYHEVLAHLADAHQDGTPDILGHGGHRNIIAIQQSSITVNGRTYDDVGDMPAAVRRLYEQATASVDQARNSELDALKAAASGRPNLSPGALAVPSELPRAEDESALLSTHGRDRMTPVQGQLERTLETILRILLGIAVLAVLTGAALIMWKLDASSRSQGGRWYVVGGALVALGALHSQLGWLLRRREPLALSEWEGDRRVQRRTLPFLLVYAIVLVGLARLLP
jgi:hypothetical protein